MVISGAGAGVEGGQQRDDPAQKGQEADLYDAPGRCFGPDPGDTGGREQQRGRQWQQPDPGLQGRQPERHREEQGHDKEQPPLEEVLEEEDRQASPQLAVVEHGRVDQRLGAPGDLVTLPGQEPVHHDPAGQDQPHRGGDPEQRGCPGLGLHPAPGTRAEHAENEQAQAGSGEHGADQVEVGAVRGRGVRHPAG